ncbi:hypothetical protein BRUCa_1445 [Brucella melitensis]|nr:hypothetical protein BM28_A1462 [Brucella melitensis M28]AEW14798.1 hypothetical protein BCA52141_I2860 [Brucella canis HSK A52141]AEW17393.1 hypothetical protein BAA13334_I01656 [Brucella abortus A13334]AIB18182.1 Hypothetical protein BSSP3_I1470 [Brucella suis bv. 2]AIB21568.1 Hypothetical protein BSPT1_I1482 [Brucella suis bv. 2]
MSGKICSHFMKMPWNRQDLPGFRHIRHRFSSRQGEENRQGDD